MLGDICGYFRTDLGDRGRGGDRLTGLDAAAGDGNPVEFGGLLGLCQCCAAQRRDQCSGDGKWKGAAAGPKNVTIITFLGGGLVLMGDMMGNSSQVEKKRKRNITENSPCVHIAPQ